MAQNLAHLAHLKSPGKRIRLLRRIAGASRREFYERFGINVNTLQAWEEDRTKPRVQSTAKLINAFSSFNIVCSPKWLLTGKGMLPTILGKNILPDLPEKYGEVALTKEIDLFESANADAVVIAVSDNMALPKYEIGDYVGGIKEFGKNIQKLAGHICIVGLPGNIVLIRKILLGNNSMTLIPVKQKIVDDTGILYRVNIEYAAKIIWHRKIEAQHG